MASDNNKDEDEWEVGLSSSHTPHNVFTSSPHKHHLASLVLFVCVLEKTEYVVAVIKNPSARSLSTQPSTFKTLVSIFILVCFSFLLLPFFFSFFPFSFPSPSSAPFLLPLFCSVFAPFLLPFSSPSPFALRSLQHVLCKQCRQIHAFTSSLRETGSAHGCTTASTEWRRLCWKLLRSVSAWTKLSCLQAHPPCNLPFLLSCLRQLQRPLNLWHGQAGLLCILNFETCASCLFLRVVVALALQRLLELT